MTLIRWKPIRHISPWHSVDRVAGEFFNTHREIDRLFERMKGDVVDDGQTSTWLPAVDIAEKEHAYEVKVDLPGIRKEDVKITLQNDVLTIRGEKKQEAETNEHNYRRVERSFGMFQRSFTLPSSVENEKIDAICNDGVLTILLPKNEKSKPKEIEVKVK